MTCKRPGCENAVIDPDTGNRWRTRYCSMYCRDVDAYRQDAQALYEELLRVKNSKWRDPVVFMPKLNHPYAEENQEAP